MLLALALSAAPFSTPVFPAADVFVDASADCSTGNGTAAAPFCQIAAAISAAANGDRILVAAGTYGERVVVDRDLQIVGVDGAESTIVDLGGLIGSPLTIDSGATVLVDGLTFTGGTSTGVRNLGGLTLRRSVVRDNSVFNGIFSANTAGISSVNATGPLILEATLVENNTTLQNYFNTAGGGLVAEGAQALVIRDCLFRSNSGSGFGDLRTACPTRIESSTFTSSTLLSFLPVELNGPAVVVNSTFAYDAGTLAAQDTSFSGCTITNKLVRSPAPTTGPVSLTGTVLSGNPESAEGVFISGGFNLVSRSQAAQGFGADDLVGFFGAPLEAQLGTIADNGGPTPTIAPLPGSPVLGAGSPLVFEQVDQRGRLRTTGNVDIGAYQTVTPSIGFGVAACAGTVNGGGSIGRTFATGSPVVQDNNLTLAAIDVTPNQFGIFVASREVGFTPVAGGLLCLGGSLGRLIGPGQIQNSGTDGRFSIPLDLNQIPEGSAFAAAQPGETWRFQCWFRDSPAEANFGTATEVQFQ